MVYLDVNFLFDLKKHDPTAPIPPEGITRVSISVKDRSKEWADGIESADYAYVIEGLNKVSFSSEGDALEFVNLLKEIKGKDDEFEPLETMVESDLVLGPTTSARLAEDFARHEKAVQKKHPKHSELFSNFLKNLRQISKRGGAVTIHRI